MAVSLNSVAYVRDSVSDHRSSCTPRSLFLVLAAAGMGSAGGVPAGRTAKTSCSLSNTDDAAAGVASLR